MHANDGVLTEEGPQSDFDMPLSKFPTSLRLEILANFLKCEPREITVVPGSGAVFTHDSRIYAVTKGSLSPFVPVGECDGLCIYEISAGRLVRPSTLSDLSDKKMPADHGLNVDP